jgi:hypothetical protein
MDGATILMSAGALCMLAGGLVAALRLCFTRPIGNVRMGIPMTLAQWRLHTASPGIALAGFGLILIVITIITAVPG